MKTAEQLTADVLARRDAYLAAREKKRKAVKKYAAAGLCVCAAALAAAGLYRSGLLNGDPPLSPDNTTQDNRLAVISETTAPAGDPTSGSTEDGTGTREPTARSPAQTGTEPSSVSGGHPDRENTTAPTEKPGTVPARQTEPTTKRPNMSAEPSTNRQPASTWENMTKTLYGPTADPTTEQPTKEDLPHDEPTLSPEKTEPVTNGNPAVPPPATAEPSTAVISEETGRTLALLYNGAVYYAENAVPTELPADAKAVATRKVLLDENVVWDAALDRSDAVGSSANAEINGQTEPASSFYETAEPSHQPAAASSEDEGNATAIIYAVASQPKMETIGVCVEGVDGMFILTNIGNPEEMLQEETP